MKVSRWVVGITGASGTRYARRLVQVLVENGLQVHLTISEAGFRVLGDEEGIRSSAMRISAQELLGEEYASKGTNSDLERQIVFHPVKDIGAAIASGSFQFEGMVVIPCSMSSLGAIAQGVGTNLIHRAAEVTLKEGRKLIVVPRETPLSSIHLENMLALARAGARIVPAMPGFYNNPKSITDIVDSLVMKVLDQMGVENDLAVRWGTSATLE